MTDGWTDGESDFIVRCPTKVQRPTLADLQMEQMHKTVITSQRVILLISRRSLMQGFVRKLF